MRFKLTFAAGFALGYTFGARAGRERYEQIMQALRNAGESPAVQEAAGVLQAQAAEIVETAKRVVTPRVAGSQAHDAQDGSRGGHSGPYPTSPGAGGQTL